MSEEVPLHYITLEEALHIRDAIAEAHGESFDVLRFQQLLSALATPFQSMFGEELFPTLCAKAGMLLAGLIRNHPFWDGNKRIAMAITARFLALNGYQLTVDAAEADQFTTALAMHRQDYETASSWLAQHSRPIGENRS
ncbi:MAG TPA: type II toxin-antitoxin system death-on-curing family toxin [Herpetosiphon sp.]|uniref:Death-on-curing family protein n=1 Tax=Herpetosiphon aurantiacus (strain ATCC 23779 / DSM 785 / 114-95) TaxID=316274 RepID=A9AW10_HERA2|nr:type II toxin-antitoxin system death-on-curing family toxin [Herpetosiphon sp.]ABX03248.1 death-on-curing family protein [Herpetosiphon aurantiacus DSM 785]HBW52543.1 type II toxin-antitoxin system death-on-curing family toxin [Herpetosiphon sp.]